MPQGDGTGPLGKGPGVGREPGSCRRDPERRGKGNRRGRGGSNPAAGRPQDRKGQDGGRPQGSQQAQK